MHASHKLTSFLAVLIFLGVGCVSTPVPDIPSTPPPDASGEIQVEQEKSVIDFVPDENRQLEAPSGTTSAVQPLKQEEQGSQLPPEVVEPAEESIPTSTQIPVVEPEPVPEPVSVKAPASAKPYYISYSDAEYQKALAEHRPILLYFWAVWCPICRVEEPNIIADVENAGVPVAGFRVNYDTESALKKQFKIPYQHTTVLLDTNGNEVTRYLGPISADIRQAAIEDAYNKN